MAQLKCPNCGREFVRRVSRSGLLEVLLSYFYVYPFKCQLCGERFRQCEWGVRYVRVDEDRREYERMEISFPVSFFGQDISGEGIVIGLSMGGCALQTQIKVETDALPISHFERCGPRHCGRRNGSQCASRNGGRRISPLAAKRTRTASAFRQRLVDRPRNQSGSSRKPSRTVPAQISQSIYPPPNDWPILGSSGLVTGARFFPTIFLQCRPASIQHSFACEFPPASSP